jgi:FKBP-type peptidyl-prolyl cis-trans isomerase
MDRRRASNRHAAYGIFRAMKKSAAGCLTLVALCSALPIANAQDAGADDALYILGLNAGQQLHDNGVAQAPLSRLEQGVKDGLSGKHPSGADEMRLQAFLRSAAEAASAHNAALAHEFLERNAKAPGIISTQSGLQYKVIRAGDAKGTSPAQTDLVTVHFRGTLLDGSEFDSSAKPGTISTLRVNGLSKGWTDALTLMKPGDRWQLFVPPELGFGSVTRAGVPGGSLLIYDLELVSVASLAGPAKPRS